MSDTDDTDILLLIPPGFFLPRSSGDSGDSRPGSARTVLRRPRRLTRFAATLHALETRVHDLELSIQSDTVSNSTRRLHKQSVTRSELGDISCDSSLERHTGEKSFTFPRIRTRKIFSRKLKHKLNSSLGSSSREDVPRLKLSRTAPILSSDTKQNKINDSFTMDGDISSIVSTPSKTNDKLLLSEIDDFLTRIQSHESPDTKFEALPSTDASDNVIEETRKFVSQQLDNHTSDCVTLPSGRTVPNGFLAKYIYLTKGLQVHEPSSSSKNLKDQSKLEHTTAHEDTPKNNQQDIRKVEEKNNSARKLNFEATNVQPTSTPLKRGNTVPNIDSFRPSSNKIYEKASKVLEQYRTSMLSNCDTSCSTYLSPRKDDFRYRRRYNPGVKDADAESYQRSKAQTERKYPASIDTDLLSLSELWSEREGQKSHGKLEEERLKREHCETVIQELQKKILEQQERLAVALRVDRGKERALARLRDAWVRVSGGLEAAEARHKAALDEMTAELTTLKCGAEEAQKKTQHFESEMYKALDLAHDYQEKCKAGAAERRRLEEESETRLRDAETRAAREREGREAAARHNEQLAECVENTEEALLKERSEHIETKNKLSEANRLTQGYRDELNLLQQERDLLKEKAKEERARCLLLERQLADASGKVADLQKKEMALDGEVKGLRKHLELQKNELKGHYQKQLEEAVLAKLKEFQQQLDACEREMERDARGRESGIVDGCNKRIQRMEEQHKLEVSVLEEKQREEIKLCRLQLAQACEKIGALEGKLEGYRVRRGQIASQLHRVMESQWRQALQILGGGASVLHPDTGHENVRPPSVLTFLAHNPERRQTAPSERATSGAVPARLHVSDDTLSVDNLSADGKYNIDGLSDTEIQHYVKMLLRKPAAFLDGSGDTLAPLGLDESTARGGREHEEPTSDRPEAGRRQHADGPPKRGLNLSKPPWKA